MNPQVEKQNQDCFLDIFLIFQNLTSQNEQKRKPHQKFKRKSEILIERIKLFDKKNKIKIIFLDIYEQPKL